MLREPLLAQSANELRALLELGVLDPMKLAETGVLVEDFRQSSHELY